MKKIFAGGASGTIKAGYHVAATVGTWALEREEENTKPDAPWICTCNIKSITNEFWYSQEEFTVILQRGSMLMYFERIKPYEKNNLILSFQGFGGPTKNVKA